MMQMLLIGALWSILIMLNLYLETMGGMYTSGVVAPGLKELEKYDLVQRKHRGLVKPKRIYVYDLLSPYNPNWKPGVKKTMEGDEKYA